VDYHVEKVKVIKRVLQDIVLSDRWSLYRDDDLGKAQFVKEKVLDDIWWDNIDYFIAFTDPIYYMIRVTDTNKPSLYLVYDMWDTMIENVKVAIIGLKAKEIMSNPLFMMCTKSWRIDETRVTRHFNAWHTL